MVSDTSEILASWIHCFGPEVKKDYYGGKKGSEAAPSCRAESREEKQEEVSIKIHPFKATYRVISPAVLLSLNILSEFLIYQYI
jgi:hypothetical protein